MSKEMPKLYVSKRPGTRKLGYGRKKGMTTVQVRAVAKNPQRTAHIPMHYLPRSIRPEVKYYDTKSNNVAMGTLASGSYPTFYPLEGIVQGTDDGQRVGNRIFVKYLQLRLVVYGSTSQNGCITRTVVVKDTKPNSQSAAAHPSLGDVFDTGIGGDTERDMISPILKTNGGRFRIAKQRFDFLPTYISAIANVTSGSSTNQATYRIYSWKFKINKMIQYEDTHNNPCSGINLIVGGFSNDTSNDPRMVYVCRVYYTDA